MTTDGGGWTVFQRREDGSEDFYRKWDEYARGFGRVDKEFWLGNDNIHEITAQKRYVLRVDLRDFSGNSRYAKYNYFKVASADDLYTLTSLGSFSGNAGNSLSNHLGYNFTTRDEDNDVWSGGSCAVYYQGAWWYRSCHYTSLNGPYLTGKTSYGDGVQWSSWTGFYYSLKFTEMKIRPYYR